VQQHLQPQRLQLVQQPQRLLLLPAHLLLVRLHFAELPWLSTSLAAQS
jgi:hypothetical protein